MVNFSNTLEFAKGIDSRDSLHSFRHQFYFPMLHGKQALYFTGNSLGLQPKTTQDAILTELEDWANYGVEGHFHARNPWYSYHELLNHTAAKIVGAQDDEVVMMNQLTVNLHLLMISFYRPTPQRYKIICEAKAFPSDQYALESQVNLHGFSIDDAIIEIQPRTGEYCISHEDIYAAIEKHKNELALVIFGGVNYYTGQVFDMKTITEKAHQAGAYAGFDLAHAAGNIALELHQWDVDFACWCSYKYLNSGPGSVAGAFVHQNHHHKNLPRLAGWWGHDKQTRFKMEKGFNPIPTAEGWQLSNAPVFSMAAHKASLALFEAAGMDKLIAKSRLLKAYTEFVITEVNEKLDAKKGSLEIITPLNEKAGDYFGSGCQVSIIAHGYGKKLFEDLLQNSVIADWREPNVIRIAPVPLYNSFEDVYRFGQVLLSIMK
ncbi:MAG TPA: kynureninase [Bacteroidia bacterium]|nr:kynureninase [Bacteroidia bacterium]